MWDFPLLPERASTVAAGVDHLALLILGVAFFFAAGVAAAIVYLSMRYHHLARSDRSDPPLSHLGLEALWTGVPLGLAFVFFVLGARLFLRERAAPAGALEVYVVGKQWMWKVQHSEGRREIDELHVPAGRPVKLMMTSQDVIHDFFVPAFRVKEDVVPGLYTTQWFQALRPGRYPFFCSQYCGTSHSRMIGTVVAMAPADYSRWLDEPEAASAGAGAALPTGPGGMAAAGARLFAAYGCATCHKDDGSGRGPALAGLYGRPVALAGGGRAVADEAYLRDCILDPASKVVSGYRPIMPSFRGQLDEDEIIQVVAYVKSLQWGAR